MRADDGTYFDVRMRYYVDGPFKASAYVIMDDCTTSIGDFMIRDVGDGNLTVLLNRSVHECRKTMEDSEAVRKYGPTILSIYGAGGKDPSAALVPRPTKPPTLSCRAARPLPRAAEIIDPCSSSPWREARGKV